MFGLIVGPVVAMAAPLIAATELMAASSGIGHFLTEVPEPGMMLLFGVSVGALGLYIGQKKKP